MRRFRLLLTGLLLLSGCNLTNTPPETTPEATLLTADLTCAELINTAITTVAAACSAVGRNQACYGNRDITAEFLEATDTAFRQAGDLANLLTLHHLTTSPLD